MTDTRVLINDVGHVVFLVVLVLGVLGALTWSGVVPCHRIPGWCGVYDAFYLTLLDKKEVAIVYGDDGMGDPVALQAMLRDPNNAGVVAHLVPLRTIRQGNLGEFDLVIVERARTMSTDDIRAFIDYTLEGGKLIWTGDAGTRLAPGDVAAYEDDVDENADHTPLGPWARRSFNEVLRFDYTLSVEYLGNYCDTHQCKPDERVGALIPEPGADHPLVRGMSSNIQFYGDFALVHEPESIGAKRVLSIDTGTAVAGKFGPKRVFPMIVTTGIGEKIAYYAAPLEAYYIRNPYLTDPEAQNAIQATPFFMTNAYRFYRK